VLDELRRNDWAPRSLRRWERNIYVGVSESRVCQINSGIKRQLRAQIGSEQNLFSELAA
jgi:DNA-directed RNA polymerase specialized sigma subunit